MAHVSDSLLTYYPNGVAVDASAGYQFTDSDGNVISGSGGAYVAGTAAVTGTEAVDSGLTAITAVVATLKDDPTVNANAVTATWTGGTVTLKVWKPTAVDDCTPIASSTETDVSYIIIGS